MDWVDLLIIGLMLLAAVHGLRLGALVQLLTFGGFFLGFLLGTLVWLPLLRTGLQDDLTRSVVVVSLVMATACLFGYAGRVLGTWSNVTVRRHHLGHVDAVLGVGVAVIAVLLSVWLVAAVITSPNSRFTSLDAAVGALGHLAFDRPDPSPGSLDLQRPADVLEQPGLPAGVLHVDPALDAARLDPDRMLRPARWPTPPSSRRSRCWARRATTSRRAQASSSRPGLVATNAHVVAGESNGNTQVLVGNNAYSATTVYFDPSFDLAILRTRRADGPGAQHQPEPGPRAEPRPHSSATPRTDRSPSTRPA